MYHSSLPVGWYLECIIAGTTSSSDLIISSPSIGGMVIDGTVTWMVKRLQNMFYQNFANEHKFTDLNDITKTGLYEYDNVTNAPIQNLFGNVLVTGADDEYKGNWTTQMAFLFNGTIFSRYVAGHTGGVWSPWIQSEQIVAKSISTNGYIKYASGLIVQWGSISLAQNNTTKAIQYSISFPSSAKVYITANSTNANILSVTNTNTDATVYRANHTGTMTTYWFAIGY